MAVEAPTEPPIVPLTADQRRFLSESVSHAVGRYVRRATIGFVVLALGTITTYAIAANYNNDARQTIVDSGRQVAVVGCNRDFKSTTELRNILHNSGEQQAAALEAGDISQGQYERSQRYLRDALKRLALPDCRIALGAVTQDPDAKVVIPPPLFPGAQTQE